LKRLFKSRAKKLVERAESLNTNQFENLLGEYEIDKEESPEEEKEIKMSKMVSDTRFMQLNKSSKNGGHSSIGISIDLTGKRDASSLDLDDSPKDEEKKGEVDEMEQKKLNERLGHF
jgi:hypothetical protein